MYTPSLFILSYNIVGDSREGGVAATNKRAQRLPAAFPNQNTDTSHVLKSVVRTCVGYVWDSKKKCGGVAPFMYSFGRRVGGRVEIEGVRSVLRGIFPPASASWLTSVIACTWAVNWITQRSVTALKLYSNLLCVLCVSFAGYTVTLPRGTTEPGGEIYICMFSSVPAIAFVSHNILG